MAAVGGRGHRRARVRAGHRGRSRRRHPAHQRAGAAGAAAPALEPRHLRGTGGGIHRALRRGEPDGTAPADGRLAGRPPSRRTSRPPRRGRSAARGARGAGPAVDAAGGAAVRRARRAHPASGRRGAGAGSAHRPVRARHCVRVPRDVGEHVSRCVHRAHIARGRLRAGPLAHGHAGAGPRAGRGDAHPRERERGAVVASHRLDAGHRGHRAAPVARARHGRARALPCVAPRGPAGRALLPPAAARPPRRAGHRDGGSVQLHAG